MGGDHWAAIIDSIADLRDRFDRTELLRLGDSPKGGGNREERLVSGHELLLYRCRPETSRAEILAATPLKKAADRYILLYFDRVSLPHLDVATCLTPLCCPAVIHGSTFLKEVNITKQG